MLVGCAVLRHVSLACPIPLASAVAQGDWLQRVWEKVVVGHMVVEWVAVGCDVCGGHWLRSGARRLPPRLHSGLRAAPQT